MPKNIKTGSIPTEDFLKIVTTEYRSNISQIESAYKAQLAKKKTVDESKKELAESRIIVEADKLWNETKNILKKNMDDYNALPKDEQDERKYYIRISEIEKEYTNKLDQLKKEIRKKASSEITTEEYIKKNMIEAEKVWLNVKVLLATNSESYMKLSDDQKVDMVRNDFTDFYNEFPIVCRYMICMGQYKAKAFNRFLKKCKSVEPVEDHKRAKNHNEDQWVQRQADYIRYLWEENQNKRFSTKDAHMVWNQAYKSLTKEFNDFKELHSNIEKKIKSDDVRYKSQLVYELSSRIINGQQQLDDESTKALLLKLKQSAYKQRKSKTLKELLILCDDPSQKLIKYIRADPKCVGMGKDELAQQAHDNEIKVAEAKKKKMNNLV